jgi:hypothetical protein
MNHPDAAVVVCDVSAVQQICAASAVSRMGSPHSGNSRSVSMCLVMVLIRPSVISSSVMPHGVQPLPSSAGRYWANAGVPFAFTGSIRDPRQPQPAPSHHSPSSTTPRTHIW